MKTILAIECVVLCIIFMLIILPSQYKDPISIIMSYPPNVIKRVEQLPQYAGCIYPILCDEYIRYVGAGLGDILP